ncbi:MAG: hypothetical protein WCH43_15490 [Verrucomicrobiota bacterium]
MCVILYLIFNVLRIEIVDGFGQPHDIRIPAATALPNEVVPAIFVTSGKLPMFVRKKKSRTGKIVHQLVETARVNGKVRQMVIAHLGEFTDLSAAIQDCETRLENARRRVAENLPKANEIRASWNSTGSIAPEDMVTIRRLAKHNNRIRSLLIALRAVYWSQRRIPPLEKRLVRLRAAAEKWQAKHKA